MVKIAKNWRQFFNDFLFEEGGLGVLFVWAIPIFFSFQSTPFALKLRGHFINISMMILAKGI